MGFNNIFRVLAFDMGASSIRTIMGELNNNKKLKLEILHRFPNEGVQIGNDLYWDVVKIWQELVNSMKIC